LEFEDDAIVYRCPKCGSVSVQILVSACEGRYYNAYGDVVRENTFDCSFEEGYCSECGYKSMKEEEWMADV